MDAPTVLLIDADRDSLAIYSLILGHYGLRVLSASAPEEGFALACEHQPSLVVMEAFLPLVEGRTLLKTLREDPRTAALDTLVVTSVPDLVESAARGKFLVKPCQPRHLLAEVRRRLEGTLTAA